MRNLKTAYSRTAPGGIFWKRGAQKMPPRKKGAGREDAELKNSIFPNRARRDFLEARRAENASQEKGAGREDAELKKGAAK